MKPTYEELQSSLTKAQEERDLLRAEAGYYNAEDAMNVLKGINETLIAQLTKQRQMVGVMVEALNFYARLRRYIEGDESVAVNALTAYHQEGK